MRVLLAIMVLVLGITGVLHVSEPVASYSTSATHEAHEFMADGDVTDCCTGEADGFVHCQPLAATLQLPQIRDVTSGYTRVKRVFGDIRLASAVGDRLLDPPRLV